MTEHTEGDRGAQLLDPQHFSRYLVHDRREIVQIMKALAEKRSLVTAHLDAGSSFITAVLGVSADGEALILDASTDEQVNARAATASEIVCDTRLERVRVQFTVPPVERFPHDGLLALRTRLPDTVLRLQRREFYRLVTPIATPVLCTIAMEDPAGERKSVPVKVLDISSGGVAVIVPPSEITLEPGMAFDDCRLMLPEGEPLQVRMVVRNLFHIDTRNGVRMWRAGCEFLGLPNALAARIQRYIFKMERDRRARVAGAG